MNTPRKNQEDNKKEKIAFRITKKEKEEIKNHCDKIHITMTDFIYNSVMSELIRNKNK